jgi:hypothetical protein
MITFLSFFFFVLDWAILLFFSCLRYSFCTHALSMVCFFFVPWPMTLFHVDREITPHMELYLYGTNRRYNANFHCRSTTRGYGVHMSLDHESIKTILTSVTTRVFGEENPTPCTLVIVPGSVAITYRTHYRIISFPYNEKHSTTHNIYTRNSSIYEFSTSPFGLSDK